MRAKVNVMLILTRQQLEALYELLVDLETGKSRQASPEEMMTITEVLTKLEHEVMTPLPGRRELTIQ